MIGRTLACTVCGAPDAISLPLDGDPEVVCRACHRRQPRRGYERSRIRVDLARGLARAAAQERAAEPAVEPTVCPSCGDDLWTSEYGCAKCGHGRKPFVARHAGWLPAVVSCAVGAVGLAGIAAVGVLAPGAPWVSFFLVLMGMIFSGVGARAIQRPTSLQIAASEGTDAWGTTRYGASRQATHEQGTTMGAVFLVVALGFLLLGVFFGKLTR